MSFHMWFAAFSQRIHREYVITLIDLSNEYKKNPIISQLNLFELLLDTHFARSVTLGGRSIKYMGRFLDLKLNWSANLVARTRKAAYTVCDCSRVDGSRWDPNVMRFIYSVVIACSMRTNGRHQYICQGM